jgi:tartrate/fumarate subfamily iron-sulfur-dependent hydro-lyase beta chain
MTEHHLKTPITDEDISKLKIGDIVYLSGTVFTARDEAHIELIKHKGVPGFDMTGLGLYHCGPVMREEFGKWQVISAGPTTSFRMESLEPEFLDMFPVKIIIGKGGMGDATLEALVKHKVVYVSFTGGAGALAAKGLGKTMGVHFLEELGMPEAVWIFEAKNFGPLIVSMDHHGHSLYKNVDRETEENLARLLAD